MRCLLFHFHFQELSTKIARHCKSCDAFSCHLLQPLPHLSCSMLWVRALSEAPYPILFRPQRQWYSSGNALQWYSSGGGPNSNTYITYPGVAPRASYLFHNIMYIAVPKQKLILSCMQHQNKKMQNFSRTPKKFRKSGNIKVS